MLTEFELWDGTSWTEVADLNTRQGNVGSSGSGTLQTVYTLCGGGRLTQRQLVAKTEFWDGTSWTEVNDLSTARRSNA